ncbi:hypothetical protein A0H81_13727 [Grifola frondosa]|uniref:Uncharacterized protein n=1 Tax=Grifola frondosa TaxID=5627 RepID=A0A1C7LPT5_GRIFR|nr:hypothetical protein A0H81_13727 [Grifola frondosa]
MTSYLRNWLFTQSPSEDVPETPTIVESSPPPDDDDDTETVHGEDDADDTPPSFPSSNSAQRLTQNNLTPLLSLVY